MNEPKFTPGPWHINFNDYTKPYIAILNEDNVVIAQIPDGEIIRGDKTILGIENIEVNINLIIAAPDMYEALKESCLDCLLEQDKDLCDFCYIGKALRKARGETE